MKELGEAFTPIKLKLAEQVHKISGEIVELFQQKKQIAIQEKNEKELEAFAEIEKEVLAKLDPKESRRITIMITWLREKYGDIYDISYRQAIMKLHTGEVYIKNESVVFVYAHKELFKQELQIEKTADGDILDDTHKKFNGKPMIRREVRERVLNNDNEHHHLILQAENRLKKEWKYIATEENTFIPILNGFTGDLEQKIKGMQFLTGFVGKAIISLKIDSEKCRRFLLSDRYLGTNIYSSNIPGYHGSLLIAKDCYGR